MMRSNTHSGAFLYSAGTQHRKLHQLSVCLSVSLSPIHLFDHILVHLFHSSSSSFSTDSFRLPFFFLFRCAFNNTWFKIERGILIPSKKVMHINFWSQLLLIFIKASPAEIFEDKACLTNIANYHYHCCSCFVLFSQNTRRHSDSHYSFFKVFFRATWIFWCCCCCFF